MAKAPTTVQPMSAAEFRAALDQFGFSQEGFAVALGYAPRQGQRWATGEAKVPAAVVVIVRLLLARPELLAVLAEIAPMPAAKLKTRGRKPTKAPADGAAKDKRRS